GPIGEKDAIGCQRYDLIRARLGRHYGHAAAVVGEDPQDVALDPKVIRDYVESLVRADGRTSILGPCAALVPLEAALRRDHLREVHALQTRKLTRRLHGGRLVHLLARHDAAGLRALLAQHAREPPRVDSGDGNNTPALEELRQRVAAAPAARLYR